MARLKSQAQQPKKHIKAGDNRSNRSGFFKIKPAALYLADGNVFAGWQPVFQTTVGSGEVVFNTGMTGYVESLTDPSYAGQILVFTYPLIGNYGVQPEDTESARIQVSGVIVSEAVQNWNHQRGKHSLLDWLKDQNIPILTGVDTRALTKHLRTKGTLAGSISQSTVRPENIHLTSQTIKSREPVIYNSKFQKKIILVDCGAKGNILQSLLKLPVQVKNVPPGYDYTNEAYDGILLSNGPGDPQEYRKTIAITRKALALNRPIFGICLGSQIMALAAGAQTYKMRFGHRGHNQPCIETSGKQCYITSQNHGYAVDETSLSADWLVSFRNLNDNSVEGIEHESKPFFSVQFHPEACPGPTDTNWLFEKFYAYI